MHLVSCHGVSFQRNPWLSKNKKCKNVINSPVRYFGVKRKVRCKKYCLLGDQSDRMGGFLLRIVSLRNPDHSFSCSVNMIHPLFWTILKCLLAREHKTNTFSLAAGVKKASAIKNPFTLWGKSPWFHGSTGPFTLSQGPGQHTPPASLGWTRPEDPSHSPRSLLKKQSSHHSYYYINPGRNPKSLFEFHERVPLFWLVIVNQPTHLCGHISHFYPQMSLKFVWSQMQMLLTV